MLATKQLQPENAVKAQNNAPFFLGHLVQPKLEVNEPGDQYEQEADAMADKVMRMPAGESTFFKPAQAIVQRKCQHCEEEEKLHRKESSDTEVQGGQELDNYVGGLGSSGQTLPESSRQFFEPRFGRNFSNVRIHTDTVAAKSAQSINALAYTTGNNIVFNSGQFSPESDDGRQLIAHELTHVIQQGDSNIVRRTPNCSAARSCCATDQCNNPDTTVTGTPTASTWWAMDVNIDIEESDWEAAVRTQNFGHTFIRFYESNGTQYTYGFYPGPTIPTENAPSVPGCVNHPDTSHDACTDRTETMFLTAAQYAAGLSFAQNMCRTGHYYGYIRGTGSYTCTTFASEVVTAAGHHLPSSTSAPTSVFYTYIPAIDNPNTLNENMGNANEGVGSTETEILSRVEIFGSAMLARISWEEKVRWMRVLLNETWITDRDVAAMVRICCVGTSSSDLSSIQTKVTPLLSVMNSSSQRTTVSNALSGTCP
ncbi:protein of unknown function [Mucilaginibacter lappiensis]|uniref:eCIS core domain-containing protein n=1 Tax=Mucilaginibacter lappiensis TaxID=354630 RepID=A0ABR6PI94_9SPHI|nr:DUF4157 domain-containing protein [Mucilaginibacter lappiensis]MBB6109496.1 hypothetical protein [Mucilaginibacter lappiensis]SIQ93055.1 protein of unknown function [Mucilaginibacter lappiensis]